MSLKEMQPAKLKFLEDYKPRWYQQEFEKAMFGGYRRAFLLYHRRAGKDFSCWMFMLYCAVVDTPGVYYYVLPTYSQGKKVIWDNIDEAGKRLIDYVPQELLDGKMNQSEMKIRIKTRCGGTSLVQVVGSENPDSLRGTNLKGAVFSEFAMQDPRGWTDVISPILIKTNGWAIFNTTPQGRNHAYDLWDGIQDSPFWYKQKLTIEDTKLFTREQIEAEEPKKSEEIIEQEFYVSFSRGIDGTFYGRLINKARTDNRITNVPYEPRSQVNTAWDLGYGDSTAITFWQNVNSEIRIIDYYENHGESLAHYAKKLQEKPYVYGQHYLPHDAGSGSLQTGQSLAQTARDLGLNVTVLGRDDLEVGIEAARSLLSVCYIDEKNCKQLIKCLENYHKKFNEKTQVYSDTPQHDWTSHGADSVRYLAIARNSFGKGVNNLSPDKIKEMRVRNLGY
jgi:phage terminase large subunit